MNIFNALVSGIRVSPVVRVYHRIYKLIDIIYL